MRYMETGSRRRRSTTAPSCSPEWDAKRLATPMFYVILALAATDLLFALDSIPAIYGLTKEPYLVLTANPLRPQGSASTVLPLIGLLKRLVYLILGLPGGTRLHRGQAGAARPPREQAAVHQRR